MLEKADEVKVWITKYALSAGIQEVEGELSGAPADMIVVQSQMGTVYYHGEGRDWHRTREEAVARAEEMRKKRVASLKKQITKLKKLKF
ncbi:hypothetical protein KXR53_16520 [Inquilinus limosus]|uniref:hypothetical protein n=1 Tax=Inquilinus limosus TaxID=171674 RepID=UPI003F17AE43